MARKPRIHYPQAIYHTIARGNNKDNIFWDSEDKKQYLELLDKYRGKYDFAIYAYVLMDNHFHLIIRVHNIPLAKIMQGIQQSYTQYYNKKYHHYGHVFQQRYKAFLCNDDSYLFSLVCYIHQNPCRARFPEGLSYVWSSHQDYMLGRGKYVNPFFVLRMFNEDIEQAIQGYASLVRQEQKGPMNRIKAVENKPLKTELLEEAEKSSAKEDVCVTRRLSFDEIAKEIGEETEIPLGQLLGCCRIRKVVNARNLLIYRVLESNLCTRTELAAKLGVDPAIITRGYQRGKINQ
jgi:putative transposase